MEFSPAALTTRMLFWGLVVVVRSLAYRHGTKVGDQAGYLPGYSGTC